MKDKDEIRKKIGKLTRKGVQMTFALCKGKGHNKKSCPTRSTNEVSVHTII
uniref:Uncharacterized protein n=1 Tax=Manihot esculenta TaxID=3983 RepID=A0A2C9V8S5_MANES